jgi:hypothetical protein
LTTQRSSKVVLSLRDLFENQIWNLEAIRVSPQTLITGVIKRSPKFLWFLSISAESAESHEDLGNITTVSVFLRNRKEPTNVVEVAKQERWF